MKEKENSGRRVAYKNFVIVFMKKLIYWSLTREKGEEEEEATCMFKAMLGSPRE